MRLLLPLLVLGLGCSSPSAKDPEKAPVTAAADITFSAPTTHRTDAKQERWLPGTALELRTTVTNNGPALTDYPGLELTASDARITIKNGWNILYGLLKGDTEQRWTVEAPAGIEPDTKVTFTLRAFTHNSDRDTKRAPAAETTCEVVVGQALAATK